MIRKVIQWSITKKMMDKNLWVWLVWVNSNNRTVNLVSAVCCLSVPSKTNTVPSGVPRFLHCKPEWLPTFHLWYIILHANKLHLSSVHFNFGIYLHAQEILFALHPPLRSFPNAALKTAPILVWFSDWWQLFPQMLTKVDHGAPPLCISFSPSPRARQSIYIIMVW